METRFKKWSKTERFLAFYDREAERKVEPGECLSRLKNSTHRDLICSVLKEQSIMKYQAEAFSFEYACRVKQAEESVARHTAVVTPRSLPRTSEEAAQRASLADRRTLANPPVLRYTAGEPLVSRPDRDGSQ